MPSPAERPCVGFKRWRSACRVPGSLPAMRRRLATVAPAQAGAQPDVARNWHHHHRRPRAGGGPGHGMALDALDSRLRGNDDSSKHSTLALGLSGAWRVPRDEEKALDRRPRAGGGPGRCGAELARPSPSPPRRRGPRPWDGVGCTGFPPARERRFKQTFNAGARLVARPLPPQRARESEPPSLCRRERGSRSLPLSPVPGGEAWGEGS